MADGFIFNHNKCVACGACCAACILENRWSFLPRRIYTFNSMALPSLPIVNLSLACNHCKNAVCMEGCPTNSFYREPATGAIVIDDKKCVGCRYCQWNCPYDAPKYIGSQQVIGKCNLCYKRLNEGMKPACTTACPTGALEYGKLNNIIVADMIPWFPEKNLEPAVELTGKNIPPLNIIPQYAFETEKEQFLEKNQAGTGEWSLIAFSFLITLSVSKIISALITGIFPDKLEILSIIVMAGLVSLFHLGKKRRALRVVFNLRNSPLSREIALFILYFMFAGVTVMLELPVFLILSSITGLTLLVAVDAVYIFSDNRKSLFLHSGQTFISALLIISFLTVKILPFIFIAVIKLAASLYNIKVKRDGSLKFVMRFFRMALLVITGISLISRISYTETALVFFFLAGELLDRILFYIDFKPLSINRLIDNYIIEA
jgi:Fe-S-cluster-containing dehydrogenase component